MNTESIWIAISASSLSYVWNSSSLPSVVGAPWTSKTNLTNLKRDGTISAR